MRKNTYGILGLLLLLLLLPGVTQATTRYVKSSCTNAITTYNPGADTCTGGSSTVYSTINNALAANTTVAGDILYIRAGTYSEQIKSATQTIPTGTSWTNAPLIAGYTGETVQIRGIGLGASYIQYVIFDNLVIDATGTGGEGVWLSLGTNHVRVKNSEIKNSSVSGVQVPHQTASFNEILNCKVHNNGSHATQDHGLYIGGDNTLIDHCEIYSNIAYGVQVYNGYVGERANNVIVSNNYVYNNSTGGTFGGILLSSGDGSQAYNNIVVNNGSYNIQISSLGPTNAKVFNNTSYNANNGYHIFIENATGTVAKNNIAYFQGSISNTGTGSVLSNNLTTDPLFTNSGANDFSLQSGSGAINAGTNAIATGLTRAFNGSAPDIGAYETLRIAPAGAEIGNVSTTTLVINFENNVYPGILPASGCSTGWTVKYDGVGQTISSATCPVSSSNQMRFIMASAPASGAVAVTLDYTPGSISDNAKLGNIAANVQKLFSQTAFAVTNNVSASTPVITQDLARCRPLSGLETSTLLESTNCTFQPGASFLVRGSFKASVADSPSQAYTLYSSYQGGTYTAIADTCAATGATALCFAVTDPPQITGMAPTTQHLADCTGANFIAGALQTDMAERPSINNFANGKCSELLAYLKLGSGVTSADYWDLEWRAPNNTALTVTVRPRIAVGSAQGSQR